MKRLDRDMIVLIAFCLFFGMFLLIDSKDYSTSYSYFGVLIKDNEQQVTVYRKNETIILPINKYLIGVVGCEVDATFENEALKTQAVVARTYALRKISNGDKLTDDTTTQCYKDDNELKEKWKDKYKEYYEKIKNAVFDTDNLAIYYDNKLIDAVYHSISNGYTEDAKNVWGSSIAYLVSVNSSWDKEDKNYKAVVSKDLGDFLSVLGVDSSNYSILSRDESGRVVEIMIGDKVFSGVEFRKLLGLKSTDFEINIDNNKVDITTYGYGHGVGLSQEGANYLAKQGYNYEDIIKYYYKGVVIK